MDKGRARFLEVSPKWKGGVGPVLPEDQQSLIRRQILKQERI